MISEETFALEEKKLGKQVHLHDGVWWIRTAPFYYKPINEFRPFPPNSATPHPFKSLGGYSHQISDSTQATRYVRWNILQGDALKTFSLDRISGKKRNKVRMGIRHCRVDFFKDSDVLLEQMRSINISQASRFQLGGEKKTYLLPEYYEQHADKWYSDITKYFNHKGHHFLGAFVDDILVAYIDLIQLEDTWIFGAVKSTDEYFKYRPVDSLYYTVLILASQCDKCKRVVNGGGFDERESLTHFKREFLLTPVDIPYYNQFNFGINMFISRNNKNIVR